MMYGLLFVLGSVIAPDTVGPDDLARAYVDVVEVAKYGTASSSPILARVIDETTLPAEHLLRGFLEESGVIFAYLLENARDFDAAAILEGDASIDDKARRYHAALVVDSTFRAVVDPVVAAFLAAEGHVVADAITVAPREVSIDELQSVAVRFFYPDTMTPGGQFGGHICVGKNGFGDHAQRDYLLEAIAYGALMGDLRRGSHELSTRFRNGLLAAQSLDLVSEPETALARAQGVVWHALQDDPYVRALLEAYVLERQAWLPVTLT